MTAVSVRVSLTGESLLREAMKRGVRDNSAREALQNDQALERKSRTIPVAQRIVTKNRGRSAFRRTRTRHVETSA